MNRLCLLLPQPLHKQQGQLESMCHSKILGTLQLNTRIITDIHSSKMFLENATCRIKTVCNIKGRKIFIYFN